MLGLDIAMLLKPEEYISQVSKVIHNFVAYVMASSLDTQ